MVLNFTDATDSCSATRSCVSCSAGAGDGWPRLAHSLVGASMGGLIGRYALSYMETQRTPAPGLHVHLLRLPPDRREHPPRDAVLAGFFADDSAEAAALLAALDSPAARQFWPITTPIRRAGRDRRSPAPQFLSELAALGNYPRCRARWRRERQRARVNRDSMPGDQVIYWEYRSFLVDVTGNVWAVPNGVSRADLPRPHRHHPLSQDEQVVR